MKTLAFFAPADLALAVVLTLAACALPALAEAEQAAQVRRPVQPHVVAKTDTVDKTPHRGLSGPGSSRSGATIAAADARTLDARRAATSSSGPRQP